MSNTSTDFDDVKKVLSNLRKRRITAFLQNGSRQAALRQAHDNEKCTDSKGWCFIRKNATEVWPAVFNYGTDREVINIFAVGEAVAMEVQKVFVLEKIQNNTTTKQVIVR